MLQELYLYDETSQHPLMRAMQSRIAHRQNEIAYLEWLIRTLRFRLWSMDKGGTALCYPRKAMKEARQRRRLLAAEQRIDKAAYKAMAKGK